ncbi:MAG TPA: (2Fe-2S)-binding protein [Terriglobia bacterium]|nr:(2Fe-2S)-binding protein [Terriglobia bacterium]
MRGKKDKHRKPSDEKSALTRRDFLRGASVTVSGGLLVGTPPAKAAQGAAAAKAAVMGPGAVPITLTVNGKIHKLKLEPRVTLLDALRDELDLTGAKKVCDRGVCGTCTVFLDRKPVYACSVLAIEAQGHAITTIEGIGSEDKLHPVMQAFVNHDAQQCGFCTPGFVMACTAFLEKHPNPTLEEVEKGLGGNLCRCGTYAGVREAVLEAAKTMKGGAHAKV